MGLFGSLFPEQTNILHHWHQVKSIGYSDEMMAYESILYSMVKACTLGEKSIVIIPDAEIRQNFITFLDKFDLNEILLNYDPELSVTKEDVLGLQNKISIDKKVNVNNVYDEKIFVVSALEEKIHEVLSSFHNHEGDRNMQTVLERCRDVSSFHEKEMVHVIMNELFPEIDDPTFDVYYDVIVKASKLYHPSYLHIHKHRNYHISSNYTRNGDAVESFLSKLSQYIVALKEVRTQYYSFIEENIKIGVLEIHQQFIEVENLLQDTEYLLFKINNLDSTKDQSRILSLFTPKDKTLPVLEENYKKALHKLDEKLSLCKGIHKPYTSIQQYYKNSEKAAELLEGLRKEINEWFSEMDTSLLSNVKYSNVFNQKNKNQLQELEKTFFDLVEKINHEAFFNKKVEVNTLSTQKQTDLLNEFIQECSFVYNDVQENKGFYVWDAFYRAQEEWVQKSILMLRNFNTEDWPNIVEYSYLQKWIHNRLKPRASVLHDLLQKYGAEGKDLLFTWWSQHVIQNKKIREKNIYNFSSEQKLLYKNILQNKNLEKLNWHYFFEKNAAFWSLFFDIIITNKDSFADMKPGIFTNLFYLDDKEINPEVLHLGKTIHTYFKKEDSGEMSYDIEISNVLISEIIDLKKMSSLEKFIISKSLAYNFYSLQQKFQIFQLKNANIISCLSASQNDFLKSFYQKEGIKEIILGESPMDRLIECLVESARRPFLLIPDYVLNPLDPNTIQSQLSVISNFQAFGFQIKVLQSQELVGDYEGYITQFCKNIY